MNRPGDHAFTGAGFAGQQHGRIGARHLFGVNEHFPHGRRVADDVIGTLPDLGLFLQIHFLQLQVLEGFLGLPAFGHVPQDHGEEPPTLDLQRRERGFHREFLAVVAAGRQSFRRPQLLGMNRGGPDCQAVSLEQIAEAFGEEWLERPADGLRRRAAEYLFGGGIEQGDALFRVEGDDGVHGAGQDAGQTFLALAQRLFGPLALQFRPGAGGKNPQQRHAPEFLHHRLIVHDGQMTHHFVSRFGHQRYAEVTFDSQFLEFRVAGKHLVNLAGVIHRLAANHDFAGRAIQIEFGVVDELAVEPERQGTHPRFAFQQLAHESVVHVQRLG